MSPKFKRLTIPSKLAIAQALGTGDRLTIPSLRQIAGIPPGGMERILPDRRECQRCGHRWFPRSHLGPVRCPECLSGLWRDARPPALMHDRTTQVIWMAERLGISCQATIALLSRGLVRHGQTERIEELRALFARHTETGRQISVSLAIALASKQEVREG